MKYYAFLKGINVGGNTKVDMSDLIQTLRGKNGLDVKSYINSGNLILETEQDRTQITEMIAGALNTLYSVQRETILKTRVELEKIYSADPFTGSAYEKAKSIICFANGRIDPGKALLLAAGKGIIEKYEYTDDVLYIYYENGIGRSKLTTEYIDTILNLKTTGRNVNTIEKLLEK
jgi:uncharacterized protein (DUF1697 family)